MLPLQPTSQGVHNKARFHWGSGVRRAGPDAPRHLPSWVLVFLASAGSPVPSKHSQPSKTFFPVHTATGTREDSQSASSWGQLSASACRPGLPMGEPSGMLEHSRHFPKPLESSISDTAKPKSPPRGQVLTATSYPPPRQSPDATSHTSQPSPARLVFWGVKKGIPGVLAHPTRPSHIPGELGLPPLPGLGH